MSSGVVYLCGHLHSLGGLVPAMYTRQRTGLLELELEDWKDGRMYVPRHAAMGTMPLTSGDCISSKVYSCSSQALIQLFIIEIDLTNEFGLPRVPKAMFNQGTDKIEQLIEFLSWSGTARWLWTTVSSRLSTSVTTRGQ